MKGQKRPRELWDELAAIAQQKKRLALAMVQLHNAPPGTRPAGLPAGPHGRASLPKRQSYEPPAARGDAAAHRVHIDRQRRAAEIWKKCSSILGKLKGHKNSNPFRMPVDPVALNIPDYFTIVKHPMDLGTVERKLKDQLYDSPAEFAADVRLIFSNCRLYNPVGNAVRGMGDTVSDTFERLWGQYDLDNSWRHHLAMAEHEDTLLKGSAQGEEAASLPDKLRAMDAQLQEMLRHKEQRDGRPAPSVPGQPMTFEEKRKLSIQLGGLSGNDMRGVLDIVAAQLLATADGGDADGEIELDMDQLDTPVLWKLRAYVDRLLPALAAPAKKAGSGIGAGGAVGGIGGGYGGSSAGVSKGAPGKRPGAGMGMTPAPARSAGGGADNMERSMESGGGNSPQEQSDSDEPVVGSVELDDHGRARANQAKDHAGAAGAGNGNGAIYGSSHAPAAPPSFIKAGPQRKVEAKVDANAWLAAARADTPASGPHGAADQAAADEEEEEEELWTTFQTKDERLVQRMKEQEEAEQRQKEEEEKVQHCSMGIWGGQHPQPASAALSRAVPIQSWAGRQLQHDT